MSDLPKPPTRTETPADYELPKAVEALRAGWLATFQGAATVSALLGGIEAVLLVFFNDETNFGATHPSCRCNGPDWVPTTAQKLTLFLIYISLFFSLEAAVTSYALTFEFSMIPSRAARDNLHYHDPKASDWAILQHYGLKNWVNLIWIHWAFSLGIAVQCAVLSIAIFVGAQAGREIKVAVLAVASLYIFPIIFISGLIGFYGNDPQRPGLSSLFSRMVSST